jgi:hypothetical protein
LLQVGGGTGGTRGEMGKIDGRCSREGHGGRNEGKVDDTDSLASNISTIANMLMRVFNRLKFSAVKINRSGGVLLLAC